MSSPRFIQWSGMTLMLAGITLAIHYLTHPPVEVTHYGLDPLFEVCHWLGGIAYMLIPPGLLGLYMRQSGRMGRAGLVGLVLTYLACILLAGSQIFASVLVPFLARKGLDWVDFPQGELFKSPVLQFYVAVEVVSHLLGIFLVALATLRADVLPRLGTWLVIVTGPIGVVLVVMFFTVSTSPEMQGLGQVFFGAVLGLGLIVWGWNLWSEQRAAVAQASAVT